MKEWQIVMMRIREYFRKSDKTNWGKNQLLIQLDEIGRKILEEENENP